MGEWEGGRARGEVARRASAGAFRAMTRPPMSHRTAGRGKRWSTRAPGRDTPSWAGPRPGEVVGLIACGGRTSQHVDCQEGGGTPVGFEITSHRNRNRWIPSSGVGSLWRAFMPGGVPPEGSRRRQWHDHEAAMNSRRWNTANTTVYRAPWPGARARGVTVQWRGPSKWRTWVWKRRREGRWAMDSVVIPCAWQCVYSCAWRGGRGRADVGRDIEYAFTCPCPRSATPMVRAPGGGRMGAPRCRG